MTDKKIRNRVGPPVEGDDFIGRVKDLEFAWELIEDGNSLRLSAPRRVGKTSFAKKLIEKAKNKGWRTLELNLEALKTEQDFINEFAKVLQSASWLKNLTSGAKEKIEALLNNIELSLEVSEVKANIGWDSQKQKLFNELENSFDHAQNTLIFVDELGVFLNKYEKNNNVQDAENLLNWFRSIRQVSNTKIKWVFCSSVGIKNFTSRHDISYTINDVEPNEINAFNESTAKELINLLAFSKKIQISDEVVATMLVQLEWYLPYFIQLLFKEMYSAYFKTGVEIDVQLVKNSFENLSKNSYLDTWDERLKYYYEKEVVARKILNELAKMETTAPRNKLFDLIHSPKELKEKTTDLLGDLLRMLTNDGYLIQDENDNFGFRSPLLKKYWYYKFLK